MEERRFTLKLLESEQMLYRIACAFLRSEADRLDAMQETALKAWQYRDRLREEQYFRTWITRIMVNECREYCRLNGIEHIKTMNDFKKRIAEYIGITVSEMMGRNEDGSCFNHYDLNDQAVRELDLFLRSA
jgi:RNA polymerase sigma factor (sigma-70 family)